ncbi:MAG: hypothetical protein ABW106_12405, partial [Steroidobacteraceae bacterium]
EDLGAFLSLAAAVAIAHCGSSRRLTVNLLLLLLYVVFALGCYATWTRASYLAFLSSSAAVVLLRTSGGRGWCVKHLPSILFVVGLVIFFGRAWISSALDSYSVLFDSHSLEDRIVSSTYYWRELQRSGLGAILIGKGWITFSHPRAYVPIDNGFMALILNIGVIGLALWLWLTSRIWNACLARVRDRPSSLTIALTAAYAPWLLLSIIGPVTLYQMVALLLFVAAPDDAAMKS